MVSVYLLSMLRAADLLMIRLSLCSSLRGRA